MLEALIYDYMRLLSKARAVRVGVRRLEGLGSLVRPVYRKVDHVVGLRWDNQAIPAESRPLQPSQLVLPFDFLPDRLSFSGQPFDASPHLAFARDYVSNRNFNYENTRYYKLAKRGHLPFPVKGTAAAKSRCQYFIYLINVLASKGYDSNNPDPLTAVEYADGRLMILNGKHRLAALFALGISELPVVCCFPNEIKAMFYHLTERAWPPRYYTKNTIAYNRVGRHKISGQDKIAALKRRIRESKLESWAELYHPLPFPELQDLSTQVSPETPYQRLAVILERLPKRRQVRVLDLGCNVGFYSFSLARRGAEVLGIDSRQEYIEIAREISEIYGLPVKFRCSSVNAELIGGLDGSYDITLCFSMLQWVINQDGEIAGRQVLQSISQKSQSLFFDVSVNSGKACLRCADGDEMAYVYRLLRDATQYREISYVGKVNPYGSDIRHLFFCSH